MSIFTKMLRAGEGRALKELEKVVVAVNALEPEFEALSDAELAGRTVTHKERVANGESLDSLMPEAFATVREAAKRVLGQRHYDVQIIGGGALHRGMVAEMRTGEGKTLVSTLPVYLNALEGKGVHVVTVNDYLAARDAEWMGGVHRFLGLRVGLIQSGMSPAERRPQYDSDLTHGTNNEFGFDYLRDNMAMRAADMVQRGHNYAIVDEVDSILIDEARTPLIISGRVSGAADWYKTFAGIARELRRDEHYEVDEAKRQVLVNEDGVNFVERRLNVENLYDEVAIDLVHHLESALKAKELYQDDVDYLLDHGEVKIVDEFTGRVLEGRRYSEGLHQAIEAKENVHVKEESQTLATITIQNYFRLYDKLAGMTGTAETEAPELAQIYSLEVLPIPTNRPVARLDEADLVYKTELAKFQAVVEDVEGRVAKGQPVLLGTVSIEKSELVARLLGKRGIKHEVLNAKQHAREAEIIAQAGRPGAVTVATNMAGRGVDIRLGGNAEAMAKLELRRQGIEPEMEGYDEKLDQLMLRFEAEIEPSFQAVKDAGGLYVVGTERHESRRIDNQLRGRSGRQGDPGESRFYLSLEDDLMRRFQGDRVAGIMERLKIPDDVPIEHKWVNNAVERAQRQVESQNFEIRKNVLKYDEVMNKQREVIYRWRSDILHGEHISDLVSEWLETVMEATVYDALGSDSPAQWDWEGLNTALGVYFSSDLSAAQFQGRLSLETMVDAAIDAARDAYAARSEELGPEILGQVEKSVMLTVIDNKWREHLAEMDYLRAGIGLRAMGQRDPLTEYQREAYDSFSALVESVKADALRYVYKAQVTQPQTAPPPRVEPLPTGPVRQVVSDKVGRNAPCPCGSGKKYKQCHGAA
jgi:preprotein translocase subunit SecA